MIDDATESVRSGPFLADLRRGEIFHHLYRKMYGIEKLTDEQIAAQVGVAARTVRQVRKVVEQHWPQLVNEGHWAIRMVRAQLQAGDLDARVDPEANEPCHSTHNSGGCGGRG
jgi:hypothetical protein